MQVLFKIWRLNAENGLPVTINPLDVVATEFFHPAYEPRWPGDQAMPEATRVVFRKGREVIVQGSVADTQKALNNAELIGLLHTMSLSELDDIGVTLNR